jgi:hypothetical protein
VSKGLLARRLKRLAAENRGESSDGNSVCGSHAATKEISKTTKQFFLQALNSQPQESMKIISPFLTLPLTLKSSCLLVTAFFNARKMADAD